MMVMVITFRILQITKQRANYSHCSELFTGINIVLKLRHFFTIVIFNKYINVDNENFLFCVSGMVFSTTVDAGGPVRECDVSHCVFQI